MANMASVAYAIEGSRESLVKILGAILLGMEDKHHWTEWSTCRKLGFSEEELDDKRLGGEIEADPEINEQGVLRFYAEERWGLQDFEELLIQKFPDINVYWTVEEPGCEVYCTNDKKGKYFKYRYHIDTCINGDYQSDYFTKEQDALAWIAKITGRPFASFEEVEDYSNDLEEKCPDDFINVHIFNVV